MALAYLMIGEVLRPQGVRGEMKVRPYAADPEMFLDWSTLYLRQGEHYLPRKARCSRVHDGFVYLSLEGVTDRDSAEALRGTQLWIDRAHACQLPEDACYVCELIGCRAVDQDGAALGVLTDVLQYGSVDTYVCRTPRGNMMAPALKRVFPQVDVENSIIRVDARALDEVAVFED